MNNNKLRSPRQKLIYQVYAQQRHSTQPKQTPRTMHLKLPNCSPSPKISQMKTKNYKIKSSLGVSHTPISTSFGRCRNKNRDSSESFMKELDLSGNEDLKDINRSLLMTSQEINKKMQFSIESYLNNQHNQLPKRNTFLNNFIDFDLTQDFSSYEFVPRTYKIYSRKH